MASISPRKQRHVALGNRIAGDVFRVLEAEERGEDSADGVIGMTDGLGADADAARGAQLIEIGQPEFFAGGKNIVSGAVRRADEGQLVEIVLHARLAEHGVGNHAAADITDHQTIGARESKNMIGRFAPAAAVHVLVHEGGIAGNIFLQKGQYRAHAIVARSTGRAAVQKRDGLALIEGGLGNARRGNRRLERSTLTASSLRIGKRNYS